MKEPKYYTYRILVFVLVAANFLILCTFYTQQNYTINQGIILVNTSPIEVIPKDFLIYSTKCRIPNYDPWNFEMKRYYKKKNYISCTDKDVLTYVKRNGTDFILRVDQNATAAYSKQPITCCYMNVTRKQSKTDPDGKINTSKCVNFENETKILENAIKVTCRSKKQIYSNVHAAININKKVQEKLDHNDHSIKKLSVYVIGIDSISRLNFIRTLPKTLSFLADNDWIEYKGYNKIGENTFPNLMAILTGRNPTSSYSNCTPTVVGKLDACNFIWKDFNRLGYITSYAEDEAKISTFNYAKKGFLEPPVDYYFRPYVIAAHTLKRQTVDGMTYCTGPEMYGERILNLAKEFSIMFKDHPTFGFFWMNSFSHNEINSPTRMDTRILQFFEDISEAQVLENAMIIFTSDHGMRFGELRNTNSGWLEERLPFLYFWLPKWFREKYPAQFNAMKLNSLRLATPYDLHMTLQDVLTLSGLNYTAKPSQGCPKCKSLFEEAEKERSCEDANIEPHWCTCTGYEYINTSALIVKEGANFIVSEINRMLAKNEQASKCAKFKLQKILSSSISISTLNWYKNDSYLRIVVKTVPEAVFEVTLSLEYKSNSLFKRTSDILGFMRVGSISNCSMKLMQCSTRVLHQTRPLASPIMESMNGNLDWI